MSPCTVRCVLQVLWGQSFGHLYICFNGYILTDFMQTNETCTHFYTCVYSTGMDEQQTDKHFYKTISCRLCMFGLNGATLCVNGVSCLLATNIKLTAPNQPTSAEMSLQAMCAHVPWNVLNMSNLFYHITTCAFLCLFITILQNSNGCYSRTFIYLKKNCNSFVVHVLMLL